VESNGRFIGKTRVLGGCGRPMRGLFRVEKIREG